VTRSPAPGYIPIGRVEDLTVRRLEVAVGMWRWELRSEREHGVCQALRFHDVLLDEGPKRMAGDLLDHQTEQDRICVAIVELGPRWEQHWMAKGEFQQFLRRIRPGGLLPQLQVIGVVVKPAAHLRELAERNLIAVRHPLDVAFDRVVETELALV